MQNRLWRRHKKDPEAQVVIKTMAANPLRLTREEARILTLHRQLLHGAKPGKGKCATLAVIKALGYVQIDTINVITRAHHLTLRTRIPNYQKQFLHDLQAKDRKIFEYWAHAASYLPMDDYRYYLSFMENQKKPKKGSWLDRWIKKHGDLTLKVRQRIKKEGALAAADFKDTTDRKRGPWWDWKPAKAALEILFWQGQLMVKERRNFQRIYDLTERVLPPDINRAKPTQDEEKQFFIKRALQALGIATTQDINRYIGTSGKLNSWIARMKREQQIIAVDVEGSKRGYLMLAGTDLPRIIIDNRVRLLSPFDSAIILRDRIEDLFEFSYSLECYQPKSKRKYGYFCLPILWNTQMVGRIDPKAERHSNTLLINNLHLIDKNMLHKDFLERFSEALHQLAAFNGCTSIALSNSVPSSIKKTMGSYL
jgi:uncharacterized protein YcaQ